MLAGQFESWINPLIVMLTVPLAVTGGLLALWLTGQSLNIYSQIGMILLIGLMTKNGILIVEFANQLRERGLKTRDAVIQSSVQRLRPILMTSIATMGGALPLAWSTGAGRGGAQRHRLGHRRRRLALDPADDARRAVALRPDRRLHPAGELHRRSPRPHARGRGGKGRGAGRPTRRSRQRKRRGRSPALDRGAAAAVSR